MPSKGAFNIMFLICFFTIVLRNVGKNLVLPVLTIWIWRLPFNVFDHGTWESQLSSEQQLLHRHPGGPNLTTQEEFVQSCLQRLARNSWTNYSEGLSGLSSWSWAPTKNSALIGLVQKSACHQFCTKKGLCRSATALGPRRRLQTNTVEHLHGGLQGLLHWSIKWKLSKAFKGFASTWFPLPPP